MHQKGSSYLKHVCLRWRQHLAVETVSLKAWSTVPTTELFSVEGQTKSFKSCSIHDPNILNENIFDQITFLKILVIFLQTALSQFAFPHVPMSALDTGLQRNWVQTLVLTREHTFYVFVKVEEQINVTYSLNCIYHEIKRWPRNVWQSHYWTNRLYLNRFKNVTLRY